MTKQIVYATSRVPHSEGRIVKNPNHFQHPIENATKVFIAGNWPKIEEAYRNLGVPVGRVEDMRPLPRRAKAEGASEPAGESDSTE